MKPLNPKYLITSVIFGFIMSYSSPYNLNLVHARSKIETKEQKIKYAQEMIQKGQALLKKKRYREAIGFFQKSHDRVPDVKNLFTLGAIYSKLKLCPQALSYWNEAQIMCGRCSLATQLDQAILKHTQSCSSEVSVQSIPRAQLLIDGIKFGETPYTGRLLHGTHTILLQSRGYQTQSFRVQADANRPVNVDATLMPAGAQLGIQGTSVPKKTRPIPNVARPVINSNPSSVPADLWFKAEESASKRRQSNIKWKTSLMVTGIVGGGVALGLYAYSRNKYRVLDESLKQGSPQNKALYKESVTAKNLQITSVVLGVVSSLALSSSFLF